MKRALGLQQRKERFGRFAAVYNAQCLSAGADLRGKRFPGKPARLPEADASEGLHAIDIRRAQLSWGAVGQKLPKDPVQCGLCRRAQYGRNVIMLYQLCDGIHTGAQIGDGQHLRLVEYDHTACQIMQLAAAGGSV